MDPITIASTASSVFGFLGGSTSRDPERFAQTARLKTAALAGNEAAYWQLRCLSGDTSAVVRENAIRLGVLSSNDGPCGYATPTAKADAKIAVGQVEASRGVGYVAGQVAAGATQVGLNANPGVFTSSAGGAALATLSPWVLVAGVVLVVVLLKRGGK